MVRAAIGGKEPSFETVSTMELANVWFVVEAVSWFQLEALLGDSEWALSALDQIHIGLRPVGVLLDAILLMAVGSMRDRTHVLLAARGKLPARHRDAWLAETPVAPAVLAEAYRGTRILHELPFARGLAAGERDAARRMLLHRPDGLFSRLDRELYLRWDATRDAERIVDFHARVADALRDPGKLPALEEAAAWEEKGSYLLPPVLAVYRNYTRQLLAQRTMHRAARLAVRAITSDPAGALPGSDAELRVRLGAASSELDAAPWSAALSYERPEEGCLRFAIDPTGDLPALLSEALRAELRQQTRLGKKPPATGLTLDEQGLELRLP
jgi:hypothetical protein